MKVNSRLLFCIVIVSSSLVVGILLLWSLLSRFNYSQFHGQTIELERLRPTLVNEDEYKILRTEKTPSGNNLLRSKAAPQPCQMETCFNFTKCTNGFKVYVYPFENGERVSTAYAKIIRAIKKSVYYTDDPKQACLFVSSYDTLDRDRLSKDYVSHLGKKMSSLPHWNDGKNHVLFNLFSGTWPNYKEDLNIDTGQAIIAKASMSVDAYRPNFDISLPLFPKTHEDFGGGSLPFSNIVFPVIKKYKLVFKGKRYLNGVGSESRNSLYHVHNNRDIIMLTTCRHGRNWQEKKDKRCDKDNGLFDTYDYNELMENATFCLVPRGRRLGSYRFIEALQSGCIPLILSNGWQLPFADVIDWPKAVVFADERLLTLIPTILMEYSYKQILEMKQQVIFLWDAYFSSVDKIVHVVLETISSRIYKHKTMPYQIWNSFPGALYLPPSYSRRLQHYPFFYQETGSEVLRKFTAVIYARSPVVKDSAAIHKLIRTVAQSEYTAKILVLWLAKEDIPSNRYWPSVNVTIVIRRSDEKNANSGMAISTMVETDAILSLDEDTNLNLDEIDFAFSVWLKFPQRIVGFPCRTHYWEKGLSKWHYSSQWKNECSMILTSGAFYHRFYNYYYTHRLSSSIHQLIAASDTCQDIAMNFVVAHISRQPPVKVLRHKPYKEYYANLYRKQFTTKEYFAKFETRRNCFDALVQEFGYMPLIYSNVRFDPVLYKDPISNFRKRYRLLEV